MNRPLSLFLYVYFAICSTSFANDLRMERLNSQNGLFGDTLHELFRDSSGRLWIAGVKGVAKYDGKHIFNYTEEGDTLSQYLRGLQFRFIAEDVKGGIWVGSDTGLHSYNSATNNFKQIGTGLISDVRFIGNYNDSCLWVSCSGNKNYVLNVYNLEIEERKKSYTILASAHDINGDEWYAMSGARIFKGFHEEMLRISHSILDICFSPSGILYAGTNNGIYHWNTPNESSHPDGHILQETDGFELTSNHVSSLGFCKDCIWAGTRDGLNQMYLDENDLPERVETYYNQPDNPFSLISNRVNDIFIDQERIVWIATHGGLSKIDPSKFWFYSLRKNPSRKNTLHDNTIFPISGDDNGSLWFGSLTSGVSRYQVEKQKYRWFNRTNSALQENNMGYIYTDVEQDTWISTRSNLYYASKDELEHARIVDQNDQPVKFRSLNALVQHKDGSYWFGLDGQILKLNRLSSSVFKIESKLEEPAGFVISFFVDCYDRIWAGTSNGVLLIDATANRLISRFDIDNQSVFQSNTMQSINADSFGNIWMSSTNGLYRATNDHVFSNNPEEIKFDGFFEKDGLTSNYITAVLPGEDGGMWLSSWKGIMKFNPQSIPSFQFTPYSYSDGVVSEKFNRFGAFKDTISGTLYFGGIDGVNYFRSDKSVSDSEFSAIYLNEISVDDRIYYQLLDSILLEGEEKRIAQIKRTGKVNQLNVSFGASSLSNSDKQTFAWMLEGSDTDWTFSRERDVVIKDIEPGDYLLKICSVSSQGDFGNVNVISLSINSWLGRIISILLPILLVVGFILFLYEKRRDKQKDEKYVHSNLTEDKSAELVDTLLKLMEEQKPYLNSGLTAAGLAVMLEISTVKLSQVLNESLNTKFYEFVNKYRVNEFIIRLDRKEGDNLTLIGLAEICGFASKSTFYRSFDREKGMTPAQYSKSLKNK